MEIDGGTPAGRDRQIGGAGARGELTGGGELGEHSIGSSAVLDFPLLISRAESRAQTICGWAINTKPIKVLRVAKVSVNALDKVGGSLRASKT